MMETLIMKIKYPMKYDRELFKLSDGGTIALDWIRDDQNFKRDRRPILCLISGLSGGNDNLYLFSTIKAAT